MSADKPSTTEHINLPETALTTPDGPPRAPVPTLTLTPAVGGSRTGDEEDRLNLSPSVSASPSTCPPSPSYANSETPLSPNLPPQSSLALRDNDPQKLEISRAAGGQQARRVSDASAQTVPDPDYHPTDAAPAKGDLEAGHVAMAPSTSDRNPAAPTGLARLPLVGRMFRRKQPEPKVVEAEHEKAEDPRAHAVAAKADPSDEVMGVFSDMPPSKLNDLVDPKSVDKLGQLGGLDGLVAKLRVNPETGLSDADEAAITHRRTAYGSNKLPARKSKSLFYLMYLAMKDKVLLILSFAAVISLALGLYQDFGTEPEYIPSPSCEGGLCELPKVDWVEGVAIMVAILIVVLVGSLNDYQKERQFQKLNAQKEERHVKCIRDGKERLLNVHDVVVGDVLELEPGEIVPVDGVFLTGHNVRCDESSATGESDAIRKVPYAEAVERLQAEKGAHVDCFMLSGSKVLEGSGRYLTIGVGERSQYGKIMMSLQGDSEITPLQLKLNRLAELIAKLGASAGLILFIALMIRFFVQLGQGTNQTPQQKAQNFVQILIIAVTVIVVAVPEGLPLAVTLALAFATRRMAKMNLLVRVLGSCETMANATVICTDKTGTLTQNKMTVVAGSVGVHLKFADRLGENAGRSNANDDLAEKPKSPDTPAPRRGRRDFSMDVTEMNRALSAPLRKIFNDAIAVNSTAFEGADEKGAMTFIGSKTETALLQFAKDMGWADYRSTRASAQVLQMFPFSSERKAMGVAVRSVDGKGARLYLKGASEILSKLATRHIHVGNPSSQSFTEADAEVDESAAVRVVDFNEETRGNISRTIIFYANQSLRTIALCYKDFPVWPPPGLAVDEDGNVPYEVLATELTLLAITAIEDPLRPNVTESVKTCLNAGVAVKMCTGDNVLTARSIATQCGIFTAGGLIMEGPVFRKLSEKEMSEVVPRLQVLARSSPTDKELLVSHLKAQGEVVGVTGDGMNDAPALKKANVGFSMGIAGTEVAKEASDIILMDDNFASIVSAIMWGRCVNDGVKKFLQFQISVNITAVLLTFISAVASSEESSVLTAVQLLWVNLIMDTFAALALATDPASRELLDRKPDRKMAPLISPDMWKMIIGQSIFQLTVALILHFAGHSILGLQSSADAFVTANQEAELRTLVFNTFVFCQVFNMFNARVLDRHLNIFLNFYKNKYFLVIFAIMVGGQALIVNVGGAAFSVTRIGGRDWGISLVIGLLSWPIGIAVRLLPTEPFERFLIRFKLYPDPNKLPNVAPAAEEAQWNEGITKTMDNLATFNRIKGGRSRASSIVRKARYSRALDEAEIRPSALMAMVPSLVATSLGGGWRPDQGGSLSDPAAIDPSRSSAALYLQGVSIHPETDQSDPLMKRFGAASGHIRQSSAAGTQHSRSPSSTSQPRSIPSSPVQRIDEEDGDEKAVPRARQESDGSGVPTLAVPVPQPKLRPA